MSKNQSEMNLTNGNLFTKIFKFSLPLMLTTVFQLLYTTIDLWTVSEFGEGSLSMSAIGSNTAVITMIITVLVALAVGSNVCISIAKGSNDKEKADKILHTSFALAITGGVVFGIIGFFVSPLMLEAMGTIPALIDKATIYLKIYFLGLPASMIYNFGTQILRALGDSKRPLYILLISGIVNVVFDLLFVILLNMDVAGVALATILSQIVSATLVVLWLVFNKNCYVNLRLKDIRFRKEELKDIIRVGLPSGIQSLLFCFPNLLLQAGLYTILNYSVDGILISQNEIVAGSTAGGNIDGYIFAVIESFGYAAISFIGQNYGGLKKENIKKVYWYSFIWIILSWFIVTVICLVFSKELLSIFITSTEEQPLNVSNALIAGKQRLYIMVIFSVLCGILNLNCSYLKGIKRTIIPAVISLIGAFGTRVFFLTVLFPLDYFHTIYWLYAAFPIGWFIVGAATTVVILIIRKKLYLDIDNKLALQNSTIK